jgi:hypothetical protein
MAESGWQDLIAELKSQGVAFSVGLDDKEVTMIENRFDFHFPPDLCAFLQTGLPIGKRFPDWRSPEESELQARLDWPRDGILFDVEHDRFWLDEWGPRPESLDEAKRVACNFVAAAPRLIPIFAHRMMPDEPHEDGNPIFSVYQTDIIYYGLDLSDYLRHEFKLARREEWPRQPRSIRFWDQLVG